MPRIQTRIYYSNIKKKIQISEFFFTNKGNTYAYTTEWELNAKQTICRQILHHYVPQQI